ncbi:hypothetical protein FJY63_09800, partial [Candidatus Sumerlaeota bacterium]|nr:hypothetical protein [Candidatus Sumerlaeota bacterium]
PVLAVAVAFLIASQAVRAADVKESSYKGWKTVNLSNSRIEVIIAPDIGRIIQFKLGDFEYFWVNEQLAGQTPPPTGVGPKGEWLNWGGDKLWPAPQGWDTTQQWPGPPGPVPNAEGLPHKVRWKKNADGSCEVEMIGPPDYYAGIQFSRRITVRDGTTSVSLDSTMTNIDKKPRRWGIWEVTQINCANRDGPGYYNVWAACPINPRSIFPKGYKVMYGAEDNPAWQAKLETGTMHVHYVRQVGKIALDSMAGELVVVINHDFGGHQFRERFKCFPGKKYPDDATVEFWIQGPGKFTAAGKENVVRDDAIEAPPYMEVEVLSPFAELKPGESYTFHNEWTAGEFMWSAGF